MLRGDLGITRDLLLSLNPTPQRYLEEWMEEIIQMLILAVRLLDLSTDPLQAFELTLPQAPVELEENSTLQIIRWVEANISARFVVIGRVENIMVREICQFITLYGKNTIKAGHCYDNIFYFFL